MYASLGSGTCTLFPLYMYCSGGDRAPEQLYNGASEVYVNFENCTVNHSKPTLKCTLCEEGCVNFSNCIFLTGLSLAYKPQAVRESWSLHKRILVADVKCICGFHSFAYAVLLLNILYILCKQ